MNIKRLNEEILNFLKGELKTTPNPSFSKTIKFNSPEEYRLALKDIRNAGYTVEELIEDGILLKLVYNKNNQHVGTFNNRTLEFFHEDTDTLPY